MVKNQAEEIRAYLLAKIPVHPKNIVAQASKAFSCSRTTVHRHLNRLLRDGKIIKSGTTRQVQYFLKADKNKEVIVSLKEKVEEHKVWKDNFLDDFNTVTKNVLEICEYGFFQMLNNVIDHSKGTKVHIKIEWEVDSVEISIWDYGVEIFRTIKNALNLKDERESVLHLSKGKFTTDSENHSGEGIFFTSRAFDEFQISSGKLSYSRDQTANDWFLQTPEEGHLGGTIVSMTIGLKSKRILRNVFSEFNEKGSHEAPSLDKTHIMVELSRLGNDEHYISRSQARRIVLGLEKFKDIFLDFSGVSTVGQGFVDEIFRVFPSKYPKIKITYVNANDDVKFMIERSLPSAV
jgi:hypothetical protein